MKTFMLLSVLFSHMAIAQVGGLSIQNAHQVDKSGNIFRGKEPIGKLGELDAINITDVIIFKNAVRKPNPQGRNEVEQEKFDLEKLGIKVHPIPFKWKDYPSMVVACEQIVDALNIIQDVDSKNGKVFFHCTAGEDRTGTLAGLYRMLDEGLSRDKVFREEMCARHFSDGNPDKPAYVTGAIQKELTPLFIALSQKIEKGEWKKGKLSKASCKNIKVQPTTLKCR